MTEETTLNALRSNVGLGGWISVDDRLPNDKKSYLTFASNGTIQIRKQCKVKFAECGNYKITHWMPLPKPPNG